MDCEENAREHKKIWDAIALLRTSDTNLHMSVSELYLELARLKKLIRQIQEKGNG